MKLCLFDIDGTLIHSAGAGRAALTRAVGAVFGIQDCLADTRLDGKTDYWIVREALELQGIDPRPDLLRVVFDEYPRLLLEELETRRKDYAVKPGVYDLLHQLSRRPELTLGLATGNVESGARAKLEPAGLNHFFPLGGFGSDSENRTQLILVAITRARHYCGQEPESVVVIGDTPQDVTHGRAAGANVIAVATGFYSLEDLRASNPDCLLPSLSPCEPALEFILGDRRSLNQPGSESPTPGD